MKFKNGYEDGVIDRNIYGVKKTFHKFYEGGSGQLGLDIDGYGIDIRKKDNTNFSGKTGLVIRSGDNINNFLKTYEESDGVNPFKNMFFKEDGDKLSQLVLALNKFSKETYAVESEFVTKTVVLPIAFYDYEKAVAHCREIEEKDNYKKYHQVKYEVIELNLG